MILLFIIILIKSVLNSDVKTHGATTSKNLRNLDDLPNIALFNDAQHRGPRWYDDLSDSSEESEYSSSSDDLSGSSNSGSENMNSDVSSSASSFETKERKLASRTYRVCHPCPHDMMKKHKNIGIKWICGGYQRARRSFKSECMMRYRNCEDGTMFVKIYDHRCKNDSYHGKHWFYVYRT